MPALDGVRAFAVLGVMAYHGGVSFLPAGFFGVDAFFVLSGFLITTLLVTEWGESDGIALRAFWARRARRLLPALFVVLVFVAFYVRFVATPGMYPGLRGDGFAALLYYANWHFIATSQNYFVQTGPVSPLLHTWSLAIEEQFYIVWPLIILGLMRLRRRGGGLQAVLAVSVVGALGSALAMALLFDPGADPTRVYFGTDTHAQSLLVGAALAAGVALWRRRGAAVVNTRRARSALTTTGILGVGVCAWTWSQWQYGQDSVFRGGFLVVTVSVAAVIASAVLHPTGVTARGLSWAPLRYIGTISYGMYLWHFPLDIALTGSSTGLSGAALFLVRSAVTVIVAAASFHVLERPVRRGQVLTKMRARFVTPVAIVGTAVILVATTTSAVAAGSTPLSAPVGPVPTGTLPGGEAVASAPVRVMVVGDSVAQSLSLGLTHQEARFHVTQADRAILGCGVVEGRLVWVDVAGAETQRFPAGPCRTKPAPDVNPWPIAWKAWVEQLRPNVVVLLAGRWEVADWAFLGRRTNILHPAFAKYVQHQLERAVRIGTSTGAKMVLMTAPCFVPAELADGDPVPEDTVTRIEAYNRVVETVGGEFSQSVTVQDLFSLSCPDGRFTPTLGGRPFRADGVHFLVAPGTGADLLAARILPLWEELGHAQEEAGGALPAGPLPTHFAPQ
jgi:peptidoglycan/LPS O-acetylase OafA/YrhL